MSDTPRHQQGAPARLSSSDLMEWMSTDEHAYYRYLARRKVSHARLIEEAEHLDELCRAPALFGDIELNAGLMLAELLNRLSLAAMPALNEAELQVKAHYLLRDQGPEFSPLTRVIFDAALIEDALKVDAKDTSFLVACKRPKR